VFNARSLEGPSPVLFNSYDYLLYFLPLALAGYFLLRAHAVRAIGWLTAASLFFYAWWNPQHLPIILGSIAFNYAVGRALLRRSTRALLTLGVAGNLLLLGVFKYADFALANAAALTGIPLPLPHLVLPLGISFFTFTQIAYLVDVARGRVREPSLLNYALFVSFFPHLLAGPILHHAEMMPQFASVSNKRPYAPHVALGLYLIAIGLAKKVFIADNLAPLADAVFARPAGLPALDAWAGALAYTFQIYFDFSGYTDMALGAAWLFNIRLPENFDSPYRSTDLQQFWRRWHMTLSRFLREYLYIPLGGNRGGAGRTAVNVMLTFLLGGLWHGAAWTFVVWGGLHGAGLVVHRAWRRSGVAMPRALAWAITFVFVVVAWVFFRATSVGDALSLLRAMAGVNGWVSPQAGSAAGALVHALAPLPSLSAGWLAAIFLVAAVVTALPRNSRQLALTFRPTWWNGSFATVAMVLAVLQFGRVTPFLYFNF
jgi:D-alanyl-lipoteichoic acid acyltransferase DltB (MBOAT superfamily)